MQVCEIVVPPDADLEAMCASIEAHGIHPDLQTTLSGSLAQYPGSRHWHFKQGKDQGTLELTVWERKRRVWLSVQRGRRAGWIEGKMQVVSVRISELLQTIRRGIE